MNRPIQVSILTTASHTLQFIEEIQNNADSAKNELGFLPKKAYSEAAHQRKLFVATIRTSSGTRYAGHVLFGGIYPHCRIFQIFISKDARKNGIARKLIRAVINKMTSEYYLSISAKVASDLTVANAFWQNLGFVLVQTKPGGATRKRKINILVKDLETPNLLNVLQSGVLSGVPTLGLVERLSTRSPVYVIDLNVLFDIARKRLRATDAGKVLRAGLNNTVKVVVAEELVKELQRSASRDDPILEFALQLPRLPKPDDSLISRKVAYLAELIFPQRYRENRLTIQDKSDLNHIATAIHHNAAGFITSEKVILSNREKIRDAYALDIVGVNEFVKYVDIPRDRPISTTAATHYGTEVCVSSLKGEDIGEARNFLTRMYVPEWQIRDALAIGTADRPRRRLQVTTPEITGIATWETSTGPQTSTDVFICIDEDQIAAEAILDHLITRICQDVTIAGPALVRLHELPGHPVTRRTAIVNGFRAAEGRSQEHGTLHKVCVGSPILPRRWPNFIFQLESLAGLGLPKQIPEFVSSCQQVRVRMPVGTSIDVQLKDLETLLSPVLLLFPNRPAALVPIRSTFCAELLGGAPQLSIFAPPEAVLLRERIYFSAPKTARILESANLMLFYESGSAKGRSAVVAVARITSVQVLPKIDIDYAIQRRGVLEHRQIDQLVLSKNVTATTFDNILPFKKPVTIRQLRKIGCVGGTNLVTAQLISSREVEQIIEQGWADE